MWPESSSINVVNVATKFATIPEILNFSQGLLFIGAPCIGYGDRRPCLQGSHASCKVLDFFSLKFQDLESPAKISLKITHH